jgi:lysophospholipase L1-like esterase
MNKRHQWSACVAVLLLVAMLSCSPAEQAQFKTRIAQAGQTAVVVAQTEAPPIQTQVARAAQTAAAEAVKIAGTQAAHLKETAIAQLATRLAKQPTATPSPRPLEIDYFALGDSIASGHGLGDDGTPCHRSALAYPSLVERGLETRYTYVHFPASHFLACSGATATKPDSKTLKPDGDKWLANQVTKAIQLIAKIPANRPVLVSITIGMNDFHWADLSIVTHLSQNASDFQSWVDDTNRSIATELTKQIKLLLAYPNVAVVITEVHNPVNTDSILFLVGSKSRTCTDLLGTLECYDRTERLSQSLNKTLVLDVVTALNSNRVTYTTQLHAAFRGHESPRPTCGGNGPDVSETYVQYGGDPDSNGEVPWFMIPLNRGHLFGDCFHPNDKGAQLYADRVNNAAIRLER